MQIGMIGLGRMGANIARRLMQHGHAVVAHDQAAAAVAELAAGGAQAAKSIEDLVRQLTGSRALSGSCCRREMRPRQRSSSLASCCPPAMR